MISQLLRLSKHSLIYSFGVAITQLVSFLLLPVYTRYLTPDDYGVLEIFQVTLSILTVLFVMGLNSALFRSYYACDDDRDRKAVVSTAFLFLTATCALLTLVMVALASSLSRALFDSGDYVFYFQLVFITVFCDAGAALGLSVFRAREESTKYALVTVGRFVVAAVLNVIYVMVLHKGVLGLLEGGMIAAALTYVLLVGTVLVKAGRDFSVPELKRMLSFGLPLVPAGLAAWIMTMADRYFIKFLSTPEDLGLYSLGYKFGLPIHMLIVGPFQLAWVPFIFAMAREENAREVYARVLTYFLLVAACAALALSVLAEELVALMSTPPFREAYKVVPLIALSYLFYGCYFVFMVGINLEGKTKYTALMAGMAACLNLGLNYVLIPDHGMMGAAIATVVSYLTLPIGVFFISRRYYRIDYEWARVGRIAVAAAAVYAGSIFVDNDSMAVAAVLKMLLLLAFPLLLYLSGFFRADEMEKAGEAVRAAPGYVRRWLGR